MNSSVRNMFSKMFDEIVAKARKRRAFVPTGPDVWFFPNIDGCYAVRKVPKRWKGEDAKTVSIFGRGGRFIGEYSERLIGNNFIHLTRVSIGNNDTARYDLTLENAVRYCYLMTQQISRVANSSSYPTVKVPIVYSECGRLFAVDTGDKSLGCYDIFDMKGRQVGEMAISEYTQYYALYRHMTEKVMRESSLCFIRPENIEEAQSSLNFVFSFINKRLKEHSFWKIPLQSYE